MPFWPNQVRFSRKLGFFRSLFRYTAKFCTQFFNLFVAFMVVKTTVLISRFQPKNWFILLEISIKNCFQPAVWFGSPSLKTFLKISRARLVRFSNRFLRWNREIETIVLSTIKATNQMKKYFQNLAVYLKNGLEKPNLPKNLTWLGQMGIHLGMWGT